MTRKSNFKRLDRDAYFTVDPRPVMALFDALPQLGNEITAVCEPFCGGGHISEDLKAHNLAVFSYDLKDYGYRYQIQKQDFFDMHSLPLCCNSIISNGPYKRGISDKVIEHALNLLPEGGYLALLLRHEFDAAGSRHKTFSKECGFYARVPLPFRLYWFPWDEDSEDPQYNHTWFVWKKGYQGQNTTLTLNPKFYTFNKKTDIRPRDIYLDKERSVA